MTPLARKIIEVGCEPGWEARIRRAMPFDCYPLGARIGELAESCREKGEAEELCLFIPDKHVWIEFEDATVGRWACLVDRAQGGMFVVAIRDGQASDDLHFDFSSPPSGGWTSGLYWILVATLLLINSPSVVSVVEREHAKKPAKNWRGFKMYPLRGWREVKLRCGVPRYVMSATKEDGSRRAQHKVRMHLRLVNGSHYTLVREHWRGDPALGTVNAKYKCIDGAAA